LLIKLSENVENVIRVVLQKLTRRSGTAGRQTCNTTRQRCYCFRSVNQNWLSVHTATAVSDKEVFPTAHLEWHTTVGQTVPFTGQL